MELKIEYVDIDSIKPSGRNAKQHPAEQIEQIKKSIIDYGMNDPIGVWRGEIVEGHGRVIALKELGKEKVPIIRLDELTDEQRREYMLVHNKTTMNSDFDVDILNIELEDLPDFDAEFYDFELEIDDDEPQQIVEDEVPEEAEPRCKVGDIWQMGGHKLICGDSTDIAVIDRLMDGVKADISITSPPYGASNSAKIRDHYVKGKDTKESFYEQHKDKIDEWGQLIQNAFDNMTTHSKCQFINIQMLADNKREFVSFWQRNIDTFCDVIVWDKKVAPPQMQSNVLNNQFEFVLIFGGNGSRVIPFAEFHGNTNNIIVQTVGNNEYADIHRAVYPVELPWKIIQIANKAQTVLDVFGGTGTTLIACEQLNRKCYMCELDPHYVDVIIQRYINLKGTDNDVFLIRDEKRIPYKELTKGA